MRSAKIEIPVHSDNKTMEKGIEQQIEAPSVPKHTVDDAVLAHNRSSSLKSTIFQDRSTAQAIESARGLAKSGTNADGEPILLVRQGFQNFSGFGVKCVGNEKDVKSNI
jgi:hypothetical protein